MTEHEDETRLDAVGTPVERGVGRLVNGEKDADLQW